MNTSPIMTTSDTTASHDGEYAISHTEPTTTESTETTQPANSSFWSVFFGGSEVLIVSIYTLFHFLFGVICYTWLKLSLLSTISLQIGFELVENSDRGTSASKKGWSEYDGDSVRNATFDNVAALLGYAFAAVIAERSQPATAPTEIRLFRVSDAT
jgi:hypothetical protein